MVRLDPTSARRTWILPAALTLALATCGVVLGMAGGAAPDAARASPSPWPVAHSLLLVLLAWLVLRSRSRPLRWLGIAVSICASLRYVTWRATHTLPLDSGVEATFAIVLLVAELYGIAMLLLGHFQTLAPTERTVPRLPDGVELPEVDVFITTYNEDVDIVRRTAVGAAAIDYPRKRVWILDDGRRAEMRALADEVGVGYLTRPDNAHAKAGNLNHALQVTAGELIAQLDADHVPVTSFLAETVPFFLADAGLAVVQTPQRFFNPDPFQRNLLVADHLANEQDQFFRVVQPGNDRWNAAFFCGSSAVLRRSALHSIGGFATETITEDVHTAIRLHARGWRSAYYNRCLSAGLAAESFGDALAQRMRWGMGVLSIVRIDPPPFVRGLTLAQRACYSAGSLFFLFGLPRLVFFLAPVAFLLFGLRTIDAGASQALAFYLPHFLAGLCAYMAVTRGIRHWFWSEVYEASLALPMALATTWALFTRRRLPFKVTPKGRIAERTQLAWRPALGPLLLLALYAAAIASALADPARLGGAHGIGWLNALWCSYNVLVLTAATLACCDRPQKRGAPRIPCHASVTLRWHEDGADVLERALALDLSESGVRVLCERAPPADRSIEVEVARGPEHARLDARLVFCDHGPGASLLVCSLQGAPRSTAERHALIRMMFCDPRTWDSPPVSEPMHRSFLRFAASALRWAAERERAILRRAPRVRGDWSVVISAQGSLRVARVLDLSELGVGIAARGLDLAVGDRVTLVLRKGERGPVLLSARAVRVERDQAGLAFDELHDAQRTRLRWLLDAARPRDVQGRRAG